MNEEPSTGAGAGQKALALAVAYVNRRERTAAEVRAHLERKGVAEHHAETAIAELTETHLLDDARFAAMFVADKRALEHWGSERIRRGLQEHGVDRDLAERALAGDPDRGDESPDELRRALELLRRRFPDPPRDRRERERALGVLLRKGYESELAFDALAAHARGAA